MNKQMGIGHFIAAGVFFILTMVALASCNGGEKDKVVKESKGKVVAIQVMRDSSRVLRFMWREIIVDAKLDSATGKYSVAPDTIWLPPTTVPIIDSITGRAKFDSATKKPLINPEPQYFYASRIPNDSVIWRIEGVLIDSLIRKR